MTLPMTMAAFSTEPEDLRRAPSTSRTQALVEAFVAELRAHIAPERVTFTVDYASLVDTPQVVAAKALRAHVAALAAALAAHVQEPSAVLVHLSLSGVRTSGSVRVEATLEHAALRVEGLAEEVSAHSGALLECDARRAVIAFYPQLIAAAGESILADR